MHIRVYVNPWEDYIPGAMLLDHLQYIASQQSKRMVEMRLRGELRASNLALAILNHEARWNRPTDDHLLATITIGQAEGALLNSAVAAAIFHGIHASPVCFDYWNECQANYHDGFPIYGYSTKVEGRIVGAAGPEEWLCVQQAGHAAVELNGLVRKHCGDWRGKVTAGRRQELYISDRSITELIAQPPIFDISFPLPAVAGP